MYPYSRYQRDIYKCIACDGWVGSGDIYCKHCGHKYTPEDTDEMIKKSTLFNRWNAPTVGRFDEHLKCNQCSTHIAVGDLFCKRCGHQFTKLDINAIRGPTTEKTSGIIFSVIFFLMVIVALAIIFNR